MSLKIVKSSSKISMNTSMYSSMFWLVPSNKWVVHFLHQMASLPTQKPPNLSQR